MKKALLTLTAAIAIAAGTNAQTLIHYWNFNSVPTSHNPNIPGLKANYSMLDTNKAVVTYHLNTTNTAYAGYWDSFTTGTDSNARNSTAAGACLRVRNPSDSMDVRVYIPTTGYQNIKLKYAGQCSSLTSGMLAHQFDYSVDSGNTWITTGLNELVDSVKTAVDPAWKVISINFGSNTSVNNNAKLVFRIKFAGNISGTSGNTRIDNLTIEGDTYTSVSNTTSVLQQSNVYPNPAKEQVVISMPLAGTKTVTILNETGAVVKSINTADNQLAVNIAGFAAGNYFVLVNNKATNITEHIRFVKY